MSFGRRAFLQFTAGVVGGTLLTPLPWKLMDDAAIWSQNWSWRPSPARGDISATPSICVQCGGGCGIRARLVDKKRVIFVEGNPRHPINKGGICPVGLSGPQYLYATYRIPQPLKQTKKRGDVTGFQPVTWDEAIAEVSEKLAKLRSEGKPQSVACITGQRRSSMNLVWEQFLTAYGSPNLYKMPSQADSLSVAASLTMGQDAPIAFALERASYVLSFGANLLEGWGAPGRLRAAYGKWRQPGAGKPPVKFVQVESRCSLTACKSDRWVSVKPGTEAALAMSIAHLMVKEGLYDTGFVGANTFGFDDWTDAQGKSRQGFKKFVLSAENSPEQLAAVTGVDPATARELAREFASSPSAVAVWGDDHGDTPGNIYHDLVFLALNALKGNIRAGGLISLVPKPPLTPLPSISPDPVASQGLMQNVAGSPAKSPIARNGIYPFLVAAATGKPYPIEILMIHEANPAYSLPEAKVFSDAADKVPFIVSFSSFMDETAANSDMILPNHMALERLEDAIGVKGAPYAYYAVASPVIKPQMQTRHTGEVVFSIASKLGTGIATALPWTTYEAYLKDRVKGLAAAGTGEIAEGDVEPGTLTAGNSPKGNFSDSDLWKKLSSGLCWLAPPEDPMAGLGTASGKFELAAQELVKKGLATADDKMLLPQYKPLQPSGDQTKYPMMLVSYKLPTVAAGYLPTSPFMTKNISGALLKGEDLLVEVNSKDASSLGLTEGGKAILTSTQGEVPVNVHISTAVPQGVVCIAKGFGHKAYDEYIRNKGVNANRVLEVQLDPITGLGTVWATRAQLRRI